MFIGVSSAANPWWQASRLNRADLLQTLEQALRT
jgi:hypothetical protein